VKLHDLHPAPGSRRERTRVGRGIAAGKGKTAGRGTKGQRSRTGSSIPAWFEGGQTPLHIRVPKLHGFKNRFRVEYAVVNIGRIEAALAGGRLEPGPKGAPATVNAELLYAAGLLGRVNLPLKILGGGELTHPLLAIADAFSAEARRKIEAAGGTAMSLEVPEAPPAKPPRSRTAPPADDSAALGATRPAAASPEAVAPAPAEGPEPEVATEAAEASEVFEAKPARGTRKTSATAAGEPQPEQPESPSRPADQADKTSASATSEPETTPSGSSPKPARRARKAASGSPAAASAEPTAAEAPEAPETPEAPEASESSESPEAPA
jgi:large subunit ribosomal protein L15